MQNTRLTLLQRAGTGSSDAWCELDSLYRPFIQGWLKNQHVEPFDADDLTQDVLTALYKELPEFNHSGRTGAFRSWLRTICLHRLLGYRRAQSSRARSVGGTDFYGQVLAVPEEDPLLADWDREHDQAILRHLFTIVTAHFTPETLNVFRQLTIEGRTATEVATEFGMTAGAVYVVRSRVLRRLREEAERLLGEELPDPTTSPV